MLVDTLTKHQLDSQLQLDKPTDHPVDSRVLQKSNWLRNLLCTEQQSYSIWAGRYQNIKISYKTGFPLKAPLY